MRATAERRVAYIFQDVNGWYICDDDAEMLDTRGANYPSKNAAIAAAKRQASDQGRWTHYRTGKTQPRRIS